MVATTASALRHSDMEVSVVLPYFDCRVGSESVRWGCPATFLQKLVVRMSHCRTGSPRSLCYFLMCLGSVDVVIDISDLWTGSVVGMAFRRLT